MEEKTKVIPEAQIRKELISLKTYPFQIQVLPHEIYFEDREFLFVKELYRMGIISSKEWVC